MGNPEEWPDITAVTFATTDDAAKMATILNDMLLKINLLRDEVIKLRAEVAHERRIRRASMGINPW